MTATNLDDLRVAGRVVEQGGKVYVVLTNAESTTLRPLIRALKLRIVMDMDSGRYARTPLVAAVCRVADAAGEMAADAWMVS